MNMIAFGEVPVFAQGFFFGGVRPIAVGNTLRRLVAKCVSTGIKEDMQDLLAPSQLGFGTPNGAKIAVHSALHYTSLHQMMVM